jgi:hypothetical protein
VEFLQTLIRFRDGVELMELDLVMFILSVMWFHELHSSLPRQHHRLRGILRAVLCVFLFHGLRIISLQATACNTMLLQAIIHSQVRHFTPSGCNGGEAWAFLPSISDYNGLGEHKVEDFICSNSSSIRSLLIWKWSPRYCISIQQALGILLLERQMLCTATERNLLAEDMHYLFV